MVVLNFFADGALLAQRDPDPGVHIYVCIYWWACVCVHRSTSKCLKLKTYFRLWEYWSQQKVVAAAVKVLTCSIKGQRGCILISGQVLLAIFNNQMYWLKRVGERVKTTAKFCAAAQHLPDVKESSRVLHPCHAASVVLTVNGSWYRSPEQHLFCRCSSRRLDCSGVLWEGHLGTAGSHEA